MSRKKIIHILLITGLISFSMGCIAPEIGKNTDKEHIIGGVAIGVSPKVIYSERGENVSINVDLYSTENADDAVTVKINGTWISMMLVQDVHAGQNTSVPVHIHVPEDAVNMSYSVKATSHNLNATSSTTGVIIIKSTGR
jgi:uncharacterized membrane protein